MFSTDENNYDLESVLTFHFHFYDPKYSIAINLKNMIKYSFLLYMKIKETWHVKPAQKG